MALLVGQAINPEAADSLRASYAYEKQLQAEGLTREEIKNLKAKEPEAFLTASLLNSYLGEGKSISDLTEAQKTELSAKLGQAGLFINFEPGAGNGTTSLQFFGESLQGVTRGLLESFAGDMDGMLNLANDLAGYTLYLASFKAAPFFEGNYNAVMDRMNGVATVAELVARDPALAGKAIYEGFAEKYDMMQTFSAQGDMEGAGRLMGELIYQAGTIAAAGYGGVKGIQAVAREVASSGKAVKLAELVKPVNPTTLNQKTFAELIDISKVDVIRNETVSSFGKQINVAHNDLTPTLERIKRGEKYNHGNDGTEFYNNKLNLPERENGYYKEYIHPTPGLPKTKVGPQRIIIGKLGEFYYTPDHYVTFIKIN